MEIVKLDKVHEIKLIFNKYFKINNSIDKINNDILLLNYPQHLLQSSYKLGEISRKTGLLWESIFCLFGYEKLTNGADLINHKSKVIMELKNSYNTDNSSSRKENIKN